jgi:hypothetical protein
MVVALEPADPACSPRAGAAKRLAFGHVRDPMRVLSSGDEAIQDGDRIGLDHHPVDQVRAGQRVCQAVADEAQLIDGDVRHESLGLHRPLDQPRGALEAEVSDLLGGRELPQDRVLGVVGPRREGLAAVLREDAVGHGEVPAHAPDLIVLMGAGRDAAHREGESGRLPQRGGPDPRVGAERIEGEPVEDCRLLRKEIGGGDRGDLGVDGRDVGQRQHAETSREHGKRHPPRGGEEERGEKREHQDVPEPLRQRIDDSGRPLGIVAREQPIEATRRTQAPREARERRQRGGGPQRRPSRSLFPQPVDAPRRQDRHRDRRQDQHLLGIPEGPERRDRVGERGDERVVRAEGQEDPRRRNSQPWQRAPVPGRDQPCGGQRHDDDPEVRGEHPGLLDARDPP